MDAFNFEKKSSVLAFLCLAFDKQLENENTQHWSTYNIVNSLLQENTSKTMDLLENLMTSDYPHVRKITNKLVNNL